MCSTAFGSQPEASVQRWDNSKRGRIQVPCPKVVSAYNQNMGGVDICDQMLEYYRSFFKTKKWPLKVVLHLFDMAIVNSWQEYRHDHAASKSKEKLLGLLDFRLQLGEYLVSETKKANHGEETDSEEETNEENHQDKKRKTASALPCEDKRFDGLKTGKSMMI